MSIRYAYLIVCLFTPFTHWQAEGQANQWPLKEWKEKLSLRKDPRAEKLGEVYQSFLKLPAEDHCKVLADLRRQVPKSISRFEIRLGIIEAYVGLYLDKCIENSALIQILERSLNMAYEIEDDLLVADLNHLLDHAYRAKNEYGIASMYGLAAREQREKAGVHNFYSVSMALYNLGDLLYKTRDYKSAVSISHEAVNFHGALEVNKMDSLNDYWEMNAWNIIGLSHERLGTYDSAFIAFDRAYELANKPGFDPFWRALIKGNRGDVFFLQGRYDSAEALLKLDYEGSIASQQYDNAAMSLQRLARIYNSRGESTRALNMVKEADQLIKKMGNDEFKAGILYTYALVYKNLGMADSTFTYMDQFKELSDSLEKTAAKNLAEIVQLRMDKREGVLRILELNKEKKRIALIRNFIIALILLLAIAGYLFLNRQRLKLQFKQQQAEAEAQIAREQLKSFTENLREKTKLVENLQEQLLNKELTEEQIGHINELSHYTILTDEDWEQFKTLFNKVYPGFFVDLKRQVTDITVAEQRMAALVKLQISSKDAALMLGISQNSIYKTRQRLRQRLGFEHDAELETYLLSENLSTKA